MMLAESFPEVMRLSREDKMRLASELWGQVWDELEDPERDAAWKELLEQRWKEYLEAPENVISYAELRKKYGFDG